MTTIIDQQCSVWRTMRPRREAVLLFMLKWYFECRCWPEPCDVRLILGIGEGGHAGQLLREAKAVLAEAMK